MSESEPAHICFGESQTGIFLHKHPGNRFVPDKSKVYVLEQAIEKPDLFRRVEIASNFQRNQARDN